MKGSDFREDLKESRVVILRNMQRLSMVRIFYYCLLGVGISLGCSSTPDPKKSDQVVAKKTKPKKIRFRYSRKPISEKAKIFLIALDGSYSSFLQNVISQKKFWLSKGYKKEEIACYYFWPEHYDVIYDEKGYTQAAPDISHCKRASLSEIKKDLVRVSKYQNSGKVKDPYLYFYVTTHGDEPISHKKKTKAKTPYEHVYYDVKKKKYPFLDDYALLVGSLKDGGATASEIMGAYRAGVSWKELFLTRKTLYGFMKKYFENSRKYIILDACHSGGFLRRIGKTDKGPSLSELKKTVAISSTASDLVAYGLIGAKTTYSYFNRAFLELLKENGRDLAQINWNALYEKLKEKAHDEWNYYSGRGAYYPTPQLIQTQ